MKKIFLFAITISFSLLSFAYPITPRPLRKLVIESEYIVWAYVSGVGSVKQTKENENVWERDFARLIITETLRGKLKKDTLTVYFCSGMICPAPGVFFKGEQVLAFLNKRKKMDGYEVHALSYGVKHALSAADYLIYKIRIREMQQILEEGNAENDNSIVIDWLVKCAGQKCTRWEGVYELSPTSDFMSYYDRDGITKPFCPDWEQRKFLFKTLMAIDTLSYDDMGLIDLTKGINDSLVLHFLKDQLLRVNKEYLWPAGFVMERISKMTGNSELENLQEQFYKAVYDYSDKEQKQAKKLLSEFIFKMKDARLKQTVYASGRFST